MAQKYRAAFLTARYFSDFQKNKAGDENRTHVSSLEGWCSTIELHPQIAVFCAVRYNDNEYITLCFVCQQIF